jgi:hypothetical protein
MTSDQVRRSRGATPLIVMVIGIAMAAGCGSGGGPAAHPSSSATTSASPHPGGSLSVIPTGPQLARVLGDARPPSGWSHAQGKGGGQANSGPVNKPPYGPGRSEYICSALDSAVQAYTLISWWSSSQASMILTYPSEPANLPQVDLDIGAYQPGYAAKTITGLSTLIGRCRSFHDKFGSGALTTTSMRTIPRLGDQNVFLTSVENSSGGKITAQVLLARVGNYIAGVDTNTADDGNVRPATVQGFAGWLIQLLQSRSLG